MGKCAIRISEDSGFWYLKVLSEDGLQAEFTPFPTQAKVFNYYVDAIDFRRKHPHIKGRIVNLDKERQRYAQCALIP